jgi:hypothetical protein
MFRDLPDLRSTMGRVVLPLAIRRLQHKNRPSRKHHHVGQNDININIIIKDYVVCYCMIQKIVGLDQSRRVDRHDTAKITTLVGSGRPVPCGTRIGPRLRYPRGSQTHTQHPNADTTAKAAARKTMRKHGAYRMRIALYWATFTGPTQEA